jgi:hypothetical protein
VQRFFSPICRQNTDFRSKRRDREISEKPGKQTGIGPEDKNKSRAGSRSNTPVCMAVAPGATLLLLFVKKFAPD